MRAIRANVERVYQCSGKKRFTTFTVAQRTAHRQAQRHHERFAAYACELCGGFHVGGNLGKGAHIQRPDVRQRYMVYACNGSGLEALVGWSNAPDGGGVAQLMTAEGWRITRVVERRRIA